MAEEQASSLQHPTNGSTDDGLAGASRGGEQDMAIALGIGPKHVLDSLTLMLAPLRVRKAQVFRAIRY